MKNRNLVHDMSLDHVNRNWIFHSSLWWRHTELYYMISAAPQTNRKCHDALLKSNIFFQETKKQKRYTDSIVQTDINEHRVLMLPCFSLCKVVPHD